MPQAKYPIKDGKKICVECEIEKSVDDFRKSGKTKDSRHSRCKSCDKINREKPENQERIKKYRLENKKTAKEKHNIWYENNRELILEKNRQNYQNPHNKQISNANSRRYKENNKKKCQEYSEKYYEENKYKIIEYAKVRAKKWYKGNKDIAAKRTKTYRLEHLESAKEYDKEYREKNKAKINKYKSAWKNNKRKTDSMFRLNESISSGICGSLKGNKNRRIWSKLVGYSLEDLKKHLESKFTKGMTWENYGFSGWHIDHQTPKVTFKYSSPDDEEFKKCWSLSNLQPLWATTEIAMSYGEDKNYIGNLNKRDRISGDKYDIENKD